MDADSSELVDLIARTLDREKPIPALSALSLAAQDAPAEDPSSWPQAAAIGLDTNALFRLSASIRADVVDYLALKHGGPIILPGQVIQEFWNSILGGIETVAASLRRKHDQLADDVANLGLDYSSFRDRFQGLLDEFVDSYGLVYESGTVARIATLLKGMEGVARVPYVPRSRFLPIADVRDRTRTPPGFKDAGHGDFYVWADYLLGLAEAKSEAEIPMALFVTEDVKPDWSRNGRAHPILAAEVKTLIDAPFALATVAQLAAYVAARTEDAT